MSSGLNRQQGNVRTGGTGPAGPGVPPGLTTGALVCACALVVAAAVFVTGWFLVLIAPVTMAIVAALLLTALVEPVTALLGKIRFPRWAAALATVLLLVGVLALPVVLVGRRVGGQFSDLGQRLGEGVTRLRQAAIDTLPVGSAQVDGWWRQTQDAAVSALPAPAAGAMAAVEVLGAAALALVLLFFFLYDGPAMWRWALRLAPERSRARIGRAARAAWDALTGYVRGTIVIAAVDAAGIGLALLLLGVPLALPLTLLTFIAAFVPIVGATVAGAAAVLVALIANGPADALLVLAAVIVVQQAEGNLLEPLVMGNAVRLHPAVILIAVSIGTVLAGVAGAVVAVPLTAVAYRTASELSGPRNPPESAPAAPEPKEIRPS